MHDGSAGVGLIGCGSIGSTLAAATDNAPDAALVACCDVAAPAARTLAEDFDIAGWYTDHDELLADPAVDLAIIGTPSGTHASLAVDCATAGVHVLCIKPLDVTTERLDRMIAACAAHDVKLGGLFDTRFAAGPDRAYQLIEEGVLGTIVLANGTLPVWRSQEYFDQADWRGTYEMDGGCLFNQGVHLVDRLAWMMDGIERVSADVATVAHDIEVEDVAAVTVRYGNGARGTIAATTATRHAPHYDVMEFYGERGYLITSAAELLEFACDDRNEPAVTPRYEQRGFTVQIQDMTEAIRDDRDPIITGREARHASDAILAMYASAERDEPVAVVDHRRA